DGRQHARLQSRFLEGVLQRQRIDDGGEHAHVVGGGAVHPSDARGDAPEDVAAADDDGDLDAEPDHFKHLGGDTVEHRRIDAVALPPGQTLPGELRDARAVRGGLGAGTRRPRYPPSPTWKRAKRRTTIRSCVCALTPSTRSFTFVPPVASLTNGCSSRHC